ncbi:MAG TPA: STAS domain-containing protein [Streptosporangiaceae bacterium]
MPQADRDLVVTIGRHPSGPGLLTVAGDLDYHTAGRLRVALDEVPLDQAAGVIIDLSGLTYCDSTGVSVLVTAYRRARDAGRPLALVGLNPDLTRVFRVIGLDQVFATYGDVEAAVKAIG